MKRILSASLVVGISFFCLWLSSCRDPLVPNIPDSAGMEQVFSDPSLQHIAVADPGQLHNEVLAEFHRMFRGDKPINRDEYVRLLTISVNRTLGARNLAGRMTAKDGYRILNEFDRLKDHGVVDSYRPEKSDPYRLVAYAEQHNLLTPRSIAEVKSFIDAMPPLDSPISSWSKKQFDAAVRQVSLTTSPADDARVNFWLEIMTASRDYWSKLYQTREGDEGVDESWGWFGRLWIDAFVGKLTGNVLIAAAASTAGHFVIMWIENSGPPTNTGGPGQHGGWKK